MAQIQTTTWVSATWETGTNQTTNVVADARRHLATNVVEMFLGEPDLAWKRAEQRRGRALFDRDKAQMIARPHA